MINVVRANAGLLPSFVDALNTGWSPDNVRGADAAREILADIKKEADAFLARQEDEQARGPTVALPDGSTVPPNPCFRGSQSFP